MGDRKFDSQEIGMIIVASLAAMVLGCNFFLFPIGILQYHRARTFVKNNCLVINADWERKPLLHLKNGNKQCYEPQWYIQFQDETQAKTKIPGYQYCVAESREDAVHELPAHYLKQYEIGRTYPCYHSPSNPLKTATFTEVIIRGSKLLLIISITTTLVSLGILVIIAYKFYYRITNKHGRPESIQLNIVPATAVNMEENAPLAPSQPFMKTLDA